MGDRDEIVSKVTILTKINKKLKKIEGKFGSDRDTISFRNEINNDLKNGTDICDYLENIDEDNAEDYEKLINDAEPIVNQFKSLKDSIETLIQNNPNPINDNINNNNNNNAYDNDNNPFNNNSQQQQQQQQQQQVQGFTEVDLEKQENKAQKYEKMAEEVVELNEAYKDLNEIVNDQQEQIDKIDNNVVVAKENVADGKIQVEKAEKHLNAARKKAFICTIISLIIIAVVIIIILKATNTI